MNPRPVTSPSNLARRKACPGSARLEAQVPPEVREKSSPEADEGKLLHRYFANKPEGITLTENQQWLYRIAREAQDEAIRRVMDESGIRGTDYWMDGYERQVMFRSPSGAEMFAGTADYWRYWQDESVLLVADLKTGPLEVPAADENLQTVAYAIALADEMPARTIFTAILRPRATKEERLSLASYSQSGLRAAHDEIMQIVAATMEPDAPLRPSEDACRYCTAKLICSAYKERFMSVANIEKDDILALPSEKLEAVMLAIKFAAAIKDDVSAEVIRRIQAGEMPGWKLKGNGFTSHVTDALAAYQTLKAAYPALSADRFMRAVNFPISEARKIVQEMTGTSEISAKRDTDSILGTLIEKKEKAASPVTARVAAASGVAQRATGLTDKLSDSGEER